jgi:hypothetical protein
LDFARVPQGSRAFYLARAWPQLATATSLPPVGGHDRPRRSIVRQQGGRSRSAAPNMAIRKIVQQIHHCKIIIRMFISQMRVRFSRANIAAFP